MIVCFHLATFLVNEYCFTPEWQRHVRDITRELEEKTHRMIIPFLPRPIVVIHNYCKSSNGA